jgi:hypothetical protein
MISVSVIQRRWPEPKLDRSREEWTMVIEQEVDEEQAEVLL